MQSFLSKKIKSLYKKLTGSTFKDGETETVDY